MVTDLRELADDDIRDYLELMAGQPIEPLLDVQEQALEHLRGDTIDRKRVAALVEEYIDLLPSQMNDYQDWLDRSDELLEEVFEDDAIEDNERVVRFRNCLEMLGEESDWQERSEAARGLATLEEELFAFRDDYQQRPLVLDECNARSVVVHQLLLEGFETWQEAFRQAHRGELEEALETAVEATCLFEVVERLSLSEPPDHGEGR